MRTTVFGVILRGWPFLIALTGSFFLACEEARQNHMTGGVQPPTWSDPTLFQLVEISPTTAVLSWEPALSSVTLKAYDLRLNQNELTSLGGDLLSINLTTLSPEQSYRVELSARDLLDQRSEILTLEFVTPAEDLIQDQLSQWSTEGSITIENISFLSDNIADVSISWTALEAPFWEGEYLISVDGQLLDRTTETSHHILNVPIERSYLIQVFTNEDTEFKLSLRLIVQKPNAEVMWPTDAAITVEQRETETLVKWPSVFSGEVHQYSLTINEDRLVIEASHNSTEMIVTLPPLEEGVSYDLSVLPLVKEGSSPAPLSLTVHGRDRTPPSWPDLARLLLTLEVSEGEPSSLVLKWPRAEDQRGVSSYRILLDGDEVITLLIDSLSTPDEPEWRFAGELPSWNSLFGVQALDEEGNSSLTLSDLFTPPTTPPVAWPPQGGLTVLEADAERILLTWPMVLVNGQPAEADSYTLEIEGRQPVEINGSIREYECSHLRAGQTYFIQLTASIGEQTLTDSISTSTPPYPHPEWRLDEEMSIDQVTHDSVVVSWPPTVQRGYAEAYEVAVEGVGSERVFADQDLSALLTPLNPETEYTLTITAIGPSGLRSSSSLSRIIRTLEEPSLTWEQGAILSADALDDDTLSLTWTEWAGQDSLFQYEIFKDFALEQTVVSTMTTITLTSLRPDQEYLWQVQARSVEGGISQNGPSLLFRQPDTEAPTWPSASIEILENTPYEVELEWSPAEDRGELMSYRIFVDGAFRVSLPSHQNSHRLRSLAPATHYQIRVEATDRVGNQSSNGPSLTVETPPIVHIPNDEEVRIALFNSCGICHGGCPQCLNDWFSTPEAFQLHIRNQAHLITQGRGEESGLVRLLNGTDEGLWGQMPPSYFGDGASYQARVERGEANLTVQQIIHWIDAMSSEVP